MLSKDGYMKNWTSLFAAFLLLSFPVSLQAAASFIQVPKPYGQNVNLPDRVINSENPFTAIDLQVGNYTNSSSPENVEFRLESLSSGDVFYRAFLGSFNTPSVNQLPSGFQLQYISVSDTIRLQVQLNRDLNEHYDAEADLVDVWRFVIFGQHEISNGCPPGGGNPGGGSAESLIATGGGVGSLALGYSEQQDPIQVAGDQGLVTVALSGGGGSGGSGGSGSQGSSCTPGTTWVNWAEVSDTIALVPDSLQANAIQLTSVPSFSELDGGMLEVRCHPGAGGVHLETTYLDASGPIALPLQDLAIICEGADYPGNVSFETSEPPPGTETVRFRASQLSFGVPSFAEVQVNDPGLPTTPPEISLQTNSLGFAVNQTRTLLQILGQAGFQVIDLENGDPENNYIIALYDLDDANLLIEDQNEQTYGLEQPSILFDPGKSLNLSIRASNSAGSSNAVSLQVYTIDNELRVKALSPHQAQGVSEKPTLSWDVTDSAGLSVNNEGIESALGDLSSIYYLFRYYLIDSPHNNEFPIVPAAGCRNSFANSSLYVGDSVADLENRITELNQNNLDGDRWVVWCAAIAQGGSYQLLTNFSDSAFFQVRPAQVQSPNLNALPFSSQEEPTGSPFVTLIASGGEQAPSAAKFYRRVGNEFVSISQPVVYDENRQATLIYEIPDRNNSQVIDFVVSTVRDYGEPSEEEGPFSSSVSVHYDASLLLEAPILEEIAGAPDGKFRITNILQGEDVTLEVWRRVSDEICVENGGTTCWLTQAPFRKISVIENVQGASFDFEDPEFPSQVDNKGVSYFVSIRQGSLISLRSNSVSFLDTKSMAELPPGSLGAVSLIADESGFFADVYLNDLNGYPENSADWIAHVQKLDVASNVSCSNLSYDGLAVSEVSSFDSVARVNDPGRGLTNAVRAIRISTVPNQKTCIQTCITDRSNPITDPNDPKKDAFCFSGVGVIPIDELPPDFDGLVDLKPAPSGTGVIGIAPKLTSDDPNEPVEFVTRFFHATDKMNSDGTCDFSRFNPVVVEDPKATQVTFEGLPTGTEICAKMTAVDLGGNIAGNKIENLRFTATYNNRPVIVEAELDFIPGAPAYERSLRLTVADRQFSMIPSEYVRVVGFSAIGAVQSGDSQAFLAQVLENRMITGNELEGVIFALPQQQGALNFFQTNSANSEMTFQMGLDLSSYLTAPELGALEFFVVVEDSFGNRGTYSSVASLGGDFARSSQVGYSASSSGCMGSLKPSSSSSSAWILLFALVALIRGSRARTRA